MEYNKKESYKDEGIITLGRFSTNFNFLCNNIREIFHNNYSFFSLAFVILYAIEQGILLYFSIKISPDIALGIGLFILITLTTIALERLLMESRTKKISELNSEYLYLNRQYKEKIEELEEQNEELINVINKNLK